MSRPVAIYIAGTSRADEPHVLYALRCLRDFAAHVVIVGSDPALCGPRDRFVQHRGARGMAIAAGLGAVGPDVGQVIVTGAYAFGPIGDLAGIAAAGHRLAPNGLVCGYFSGSARGAHPAPSTDFMVLNGALIARLARADLWQGPPDAVEENLGSYLRAHGVPLASLSALTQGFAQGTAYDGTGLALAEGAPCLPCAIATMDPIYHDMAAQDLRRILAQLRTCAPRLERAIHGFAARHIPARDWAAITDAYAVLNEDGPVHLPHAALRIAVLMHVYFAEDFAELHAVARNIPTGFALFVSVANDTAARRIASHLAAQGAAAATIRKVAQNRGRDMAALFITFADVASSGDFDLILRLHSKRSPQLPPPVSAQFRTHLFSNLAASPAYVGAILQRFADDPALGLVMPPAIQIGFGTLGHGWYSNRAPLEDVARKIGLSGPFDAHTPLAPFGTMFWFRPAALRALFAYPWRFDDYNREPHHIDGGLAHVQERLIGYAARAAGYDVLQVMTQAQAARNYARLEYKFQRFAGHLMAASAPEQLIELQRARPPRALRLHARLARAYARLLRHSPRLRLWLRPFARRMSALLTG